GYSMYHVAVAPLDSDRQPPAPPSQPPAPPAAPPAPGAPVPPVNSPPLIGGTPQATVVVGNQYRFVPSATDPNGDALTFSIGNKPAWASFDAGTGRLSGTPSVAAAGTYNNVVIVASDGQAVAILPVFSITVTVTTTGSATLSWAAPTENADGTPLTDLAGYRVYYGKTYGNYSSSKAINNPGVVTTVIDNLSEGTWFFVVTARDLNGNESEESNVASKTIVLP
ncbi:MAG: putative Ig domain-containing protein, partial [Gammaproteobacteria bacterium]|nr:putative Ig domain-containing protein [Gammaproteobacteria bacterium]